ncbi:hypothetical protein [uncultured Paracoccus sp.]|uniref:hypothetical protein n=1 Tax=uncultured Paracoccus sp. TaxID=189685 RepID=UPI002602C225|nr:hypothetical protein [uncultured Paracoccus sp.]
MPARPPADRRPKLLRIHLDGPMLANARARRFNFLNVLTDAVRDAGWQVALLPEGPAADGDDLPEGVHALHHMRRPSHPRALSFRRAYHYPFWFIEPVAERWRFAVARAAFDPAQIDGAAAAAFAERLRARVLPGPPPRRGRHVLVPLQGHVRRCRSFQTMSPVAMLDRVCATGLPVAATLHPRERYDADDRAALAALAARHPNLTIGGDSAALLRDCAWVAAQNSAVCFDGFLLHKPAVLFGQIDFHHIGLNVAALGVETALDRAPDHAPAFDRYLYWFLQMQAINATRPDAPDRIRAAMRRGGWPI